MFEMLKTHPAVFAVGENYQIMVTVNKPSLFWVRVGDKEYYDGSNGILRSLSDLHRAEVPMSELDRTGEYTVCVHPLIERKPYFTETEPVVEYTYKFKPVPKGRARAYHISDAHNLIDPPVKAAETFGAIDFLILNGDVLDHSGDPSKFDNIYEIASRLTGGELPVVFSRGNHDLRGNYAERFAEYTPNENGKTYYTFRLGGIYGILLDCGEDKRDDSTEYGGTICCHDFRMRETEYLKALTQGAEYDAESVEHKVVISHVPFTHKMNPPFDIEEELYREWARLLRDDIKPEVMICGHIHCTEVWREGCERDTYGQACPVVIGGDIKYQENYFVGCGYEFSEDGTEVTFTDSNGAVKGKERI